MIREAKERLRKKTVISSALFERKREETMAKAKRSTPEDLTKIFSKLIRAASDVLEDEAGKVVKSSKGRANQIVDATIVAVHNTLKAGVNQLDQLQKKRTAPKDPPVVPPANK